MNKTQLIHSTHICQVLSVDHHGDREVRGEELLISKSVESSGKVIKVPQDKLKAALC